MVSAAMGRLSTEYFKGGSALRELAEVNGSEKCAYDSNVPLSVNVLLKEAFLKFCAAAVHDT
jgi:hypothetical protein